MSKYNVKPLSEDEIEIADRVALWYDHHRQQSAASYRAGSYRWMPEASLDLAKIHLAADLAKLYGDQAQSDLLAALARIEKLLTQQDSTANVIRKFLDAPLPTGIKVVSDSEDKPDKRCNMCGDWATWETALDTKYKGCNIHGPDMLIHDGTSYAIIPVIQPSDDHPCKEEANGENKT